MALCSGDYKRTILMGGKKMIKVSILMPACNVKRYIEECMDSVVNQTLVEIEIICINDGSTDGTGEILDKYSYKDKRIKIVHKANSGYGHSMNIALSMAQGEYVGIVETDDFVSKDMFEVLYNTAVKYDADVVKSNYYRYKSIPYPESAFFEVLKPVGRYDEVFDPAEHRDIFKVAPCIWSGIYRRSMLLENNVVFNETPGASYQDTSFAFKVWASAHRVYLLHDAFLHYRVDNDNSSVKAPGKVFCICDEYKEIERYLETYPEKKQRYEKLKNVLKYESYRWNLHRLSFGFKYAFMLQMKKEFEQAHKDDCLDQQLFRKNDWEKLIQLLKTPNEYYTTECCAVLQPYKSVEELRSAFENLNIQFTHMKNSKSLIVGRLFTLIPRKIRDIMGR